jgi:oxygen-independent coproporphyrinogen-3 oxidase
MTPIPLSIYIHIPWCVRKCPYCDFNSHEAPQSIPEERYIEALLTDLETELPHIWGRPIESIFIGGGTPSLFSAKSIDHLICGLRERLPIRPHMEITMEANPGTFEQERFSAYRQAGINRLSIGIQSFSNKKLTALGRIHNGSEALKAAEIAHKAGFENFNLDLMFGLPKQTIKQALNDLQQAIDCKPTHLSWYQLTLEENTLFYHSQPTLPEDELLWDMMLQGQTLLKQSGFIQYEVSAYSKKDWQCRHNNNYWQFGDYLGIGAGAHGKLTMPTGEISRHSKYRHPEKYMENALNGNARSKESVLNDEDLRFEFLLNAIRLKQGFKQTLFEDRTLLPFSTIEEDLLKIVDADLMKIVDNNYVTTTRGWMFIDDILKSLL